jgi:hypothetical protein
LTVCCSACARVFSLQGLGFGFERRPRGVDLRLDLLGDLLQARRRRHADLGVRQHGLLRQKTDARERRTTQRLGRRGLRRPRAG